MLYRWFKEEKCIVAGIPRKINHDPDYCLNIVSASEHP